jgi:uncharacterized protein (TIGR02118 family)
MAVVRVCYKSGVRFDEAYYMSRHWALAMAVMGPLGLKHAEVVRIGPNPDGSLPAYQVMFSGYFDSIAELQSAMANPRMGEVLADIPSYYDGGAPDVFVGEVLPAPVLR